VNAEDFFHLAFPNIDFQRILILLVRQQIEKIP
jgi:hypothetical protein